MNDWSKVVCVVDAMFIGICVEYREYGGAAFLFCLLLTLLVNELIVGEKR